MKKKLVIVVGGYYPFYGNPMGIVLEQIVPHLVSMYDVMIISLKRSAQQIDTRPCWHNGANVITITSFLHEILLRNNAIVKSCYRLFARMKMGRFEDYWIGMMANGLERLYAKYPFDGILSLGFPMQMHEAAKRFKLNHPAIKWVTYSTDSCYDNTNLTCIHNPWLKNIAVSRLVQRERAFREMADYNFVSREIFNSTPEALKFVKDKCDVLDYTILPKKQDLDSSFTDNIVRIVYAGGMPTKMRDPSYFLKVFCSLSPSINARLDVYLIGEKPEALRIAEMALPGKVVVHPAVKHSEIERIYEHEADVLLNLGNNSDVFCPSKLFDYISTGKPIIDVYYNGSLPNPAILRYPLAFRLKNYGNIEQDVNSLNKFINQTMASRLSEERLRELYPDYLPEFVAKKIDRALNMEAGKPIMV